MTTAAATKAARGKRPPPNSCHAWTNASRGWPTPRTGSAGRWRRSSTAAATPRRARPGAPRVTTIDRLRHPSISEAVTRAAGIDPKPTPSRGVTRWTAQARRAVSPAARPTSWKSARGPGQRGATAKRPRREMHSPPMPASKPPCVATARSWPTAPAGDGRTQCDSMGCSTRPGRVPPVGSGPLAARPGREGYPGRFRPMVEANVSARTQCPGWPSLRGSPSR